MNCFFYRILRAYALVPDAMNEKRYDKWKNSWINVKFRGQESRQATHFFLLLSKRFYQWVNIFVALQQIFWHTSTEKFVFIRKKYLNVIFLLKWLPLFVDIIEEIKNNCHGVNIFHLHEGPSLIQLELNPWILISCVESVVVKCN